MKVVLILWGLVTIACLIAAHLFDARDAASAVYDRASGLMIGAVLGALLKELGR